MKTTRTRIIPVLTLLAALGLGACENPVEHGEEHPVGLVVVNASGQEVARRAESGSVTGQISVTRGTPATFTVFALAEDGDRLDIDGSELGLVVTQPMAGATVTLQAGNQLVVTGTQPVTTSVRLTLTHGGHDELFADFPIVVGS